ncbi:hypothetical protein BLNAU_11643 [Blattamonas nauphoetae]|uniref:Uncharacterized protein n=1 Tax=Blattamonas nauphoetae TaxID=2049346 RepID=A0ABQ9XPT9_9EUKA|nr:hypothetical protein BLNAU_11643 [Blattamonas nauphoetae]
MEWELKVCEERLVRELLCRNPEHFKIEGNVITRTAFDSTGLNSPFSTVLFDGVVENAIKSVTITILALPQTEHSCGVVMVGCLFAGRFIPKSPKGLGIEKKYSFALCSIDGMIHRSKERKSSFKPCHSPLRVGDQVVLEVDTRSDACTSRFFVNGKAGEREISDIEEKQHFGFSLTGAGTSIRIDAVTDPDKPSQDGITIADIAKTNESEDLDEAPKIAEAAKFAKKIPSEHEQSAPLPTTQPKQSMLQPSAQKTDSVRNPTDASSSTSKVPLKPQPLAAKVSDRDHPAYEPFFAKLKSGKKAVFLAPEMREKGLNPAALSDPDMLV